jgi:hypothetical protein
VQRADLCLGANGMYWVRCSWGLAHQSPHRTETQP